MTLAPGQAATRSTGAPGEEVIAPPLTWAAYRRGTAGPGFGARAAAALADRFLVASRR
jgi:hypothetical protein